MRKEWLFLILYFCILPSVCPWCIPSSNQCGCSKQTPLFSQWKIVGGSTARNHSWPWVVSIRYASGFELPTSPGRAFCGGTLLSQRHVLTAAHCFFNADLSIMSNYFVVVGAHYIIDTNPIRFQVKTVIMHENYTDETYLNDIAILELTRPVDFNDPTVGFICLPPRENSSYPIEQTIAVAVGWGRLNESGLASFSLQQVELPIIGDSDQLCTDQRNDQLVQFCAGFSQGGKDTCQGDSGGPLMVFDPINSTWIIAGITSFGAGCARPNNPGVYTRVSMFTDWINAHVNNSASQSIILESRQAIVFSVFFSIIFYL